MWKIRDVKRKALEAVKNNYIKVVIVAIILGIAAISIRINIDFNDKDVVIENDEAGKVAVVESVISGDRNPKENLEALLQSLEDDLDGALEEARPIIDEEFGGSVETFLLVVVGACVLVAMVIVTLAILFGLFVLNPLQVGCRKFFVKNIEEKALLDNFADGFGPGYKNVVKTMFFRQLYTALWMSLFIVPGIIKAYEYRMIPYILAKNPEISTKEAFAISKKMMMGNKMKAFLFDLSFIGWKILDTFTLGLSKVLFTNPYKYQAEAVLFMALDGSDFSKQEVSDEDFEVYMEV